MRKGNHREARLQDGTEPFVHVLPFKCPQCAKPSASAMPSAKRSLEEVDGASIAIQCFCGWSGDLVGIEARRHWVELWEN
jgi:hypothetical protein